MHASVQNNEKISVFLPLEGTMDWSGSEHRRSSWIELDWVSKFVNGVGLDLAKCTHIPLWPITSTLLSFLTQSNLQCGKDYLRNNALALNIQNRPDLIVWTEEEVGNDTNWRGKRG